MRDRRRELRREGREGSWREIGYLVHHSCSLHSIDRNSNHCTPGVVDLFHPAEARQEEPGPREPEPGTETFLVPSALLTS